VQLLVKAAALGVVQGPPHGRVPARLGTYLAEALRDPRFATMWAEGDESRAYAAACLSMSRLRRTTATGRRVRYDAIVTRRRREFLSELSGAALPKSALSILARCNWTELSGPSWRRLLRIISGEATIAVPAGGTSLRVVVDDLRPALWHSPRIGPRLIRQLSLIPPSLRTPSLLEVADRWPIERERWEMLAEDLARIDRSRRSAFEREANEVRSYADLRDLLLKVCEAARDVVPFQGLPDLGPRLVPLRDGREMRREGHSMRNCLADHIDEAASGQRVYYRWVGGPVRASVSLWRTPLGFVVDQLAGIGNAVLGPTTAAEIRSELAAALGPEVLDEDRTPALPPLFVKPGFARLVRLGMRNLSSKAHAQLAQELRSAWAESLHGPIHYLSVSAGQLNVKAVADCWAGAFQVAVASHHSRPEVGAYLNPSRARLLEDAGLAWPQAGRDFTCSIPVAADEDCTRLAGALVGIFHGVFGLTSGRKVSIRPRRM